LAAARARDLRAEIAREREHDRAFEQSRMVSCFIFYNSYNYYFFDGGSSFTPFGSFV
jgi:hypothetical protein